MSLPYLHNQESTSPSQGCLESVSQHHSRTNSPRGPRPTSAMCTRTPISDINFIKSKDYETAKSLLSNKDVGVLVITGTSGSGKSEAAMKIVKEMVDDSPQTTHAHFNCETQQGLINDIEAFCNKKKIPFDALSVDTGNEALEVLFEELDKSEQPKVLLFDDAEYLQKGADAKPSTLINFLGDFLQKEKNKKKKVEKWTFLVTTQTQVEGKLHPHTKVAEFHGFDKAEAKKFLPDAIDDDAVEQILGTVGNLPIALSVIAKDIETDRLTSTGSKARNALKKSLKRIKEQWSTMGPDTNTNKALALLKISLSRFLEDVKGEDQGRRSRLMKKLVTMLTLCDERNITMEMIISCAEMVVTDYEAAEVLAKDLVEELFKRNLSYKPEHSSGLVLISLHKLVKESMKLFMVPEERRENVRDTLIAFSRVMPRDGRDHQSHILETMYQHGHNLKQEIKKLMDEEDELLQISIDTSPFIMMLYVVLNTSMGYCQLAQRRKSDLGLRKIEKAVSEFTLLVTGGRQRRYSQLGREPQHPADAPVPDNAAIEALYNHAKYPKMYLKGDDYQQYADFIKDLHKYQRVTKKDVLNLLNTEDSDDEYRTNDHFSVSGIKRLRRDFNNKHVLSDDVMMQVYPLEILADIFSIWSKAYGRFGGNGKGKEGGENRYTEERR